MSKTYRHPRKIKVDGKAGKTKVKASYGIPDVDLALHQYAAAKRLAKLRKRDRQWGLASASAVTPRLLIG